MPSFVALRFSNTRIKLAIIGIIMTHVEDCTVQTIVQTFTYYLMLFTQIRHVVHKTYKNKKP